MKRGSIESLYRGRPTGYLGSVGQEQRARQTESQSARHERQVLENFLARQRDILLQSGHSEQWGTFTVTNRKGVSREITWQLTADERSYRLVLSEGARRQYYEGVISPGSDLSLPRFSLTVRGDQLCSETDVAQGIRVTISEE
jgi:hypothetical protein